jgi:hypothetical protein
MPTHEELKAFSGEHRCYEISMLYEVTLKLARREADQITGNALIESFGIHAAIILDFIYRRRDKELAHLSYERLQVTAITKQWSFIAICREISDLVDYFIDMSDKTITHPNILKLKNYFRNNPLCKSIPNFDRISLIANPTDPGTPVVIYIPPRELKEHVLVN